MNKRYLYPKNWNSLRCMIIIRDKFCCTICGKYESTLVSKKGKKLSLHVMHLDGNTFNNKYVLDGPVFNNPNNNLASGCPNCHRIYDLNSNNQVHTKIKIANVVVDLSNMASIDLLK